MSSYPTPIRDSSETCFLQALETAKDIALDMDIDALFHTRHKIKRKRHFDENLDDTNVKTLSAKERRMLDSMVRWYPRKTSFATWDHCSKRIGISMKILVIELKLAG
jgi:hypothetical protein